MPCNRFKVLQQILHFVDDSAFSEGSQKVFKVSPVIEAVGNQCLKVESKTCHAVDEQIIPSKTKYTGIRQYNPKKPCKWGFRNMVRVGRSGFMYNSYLYNANRLCSNLLTVGATKPKHWRMYLALRLCQCTMQTWEELTWLSCWFLVRDRSQKTSHGWRCHRKCMAYIPEVQQTSRLSTQ